MSRSRLWPRSARRHPAAHNRPSGAIHESPVRHRGRPAAMQRRPWFFVQWHGGVALIELQNLSKVYGQFAAVQPLNLRVERGEVFGFLGPNGAGKTTTIRMLVGILVPSEGRALIDGLDCQT